MNLSWESSRRLRDRNGQDAERELMFRCTTERYDVLYARWLRDPGTLLDFAKYDPSKSILDLCGGTGIISKEALRRGATDVTLFDLNPRIADSRVKSVRGDFNKASDRALLGRQFDFIICRQSLAYLDPFQVSANILDLLTPNGRFVFNIFTKPKSGIKRYEYDGKAYVEAALVIGRRVFHMQHCRGQGTDFSTFRNNDLALSVGLLVTKAWAWKQKVGERSVWIMIQKEPATPL